MAAQGFYHCSIKSVGRAKGRSVVAAAAYRAGSKLVDQQTGIAYDFSRRRGVLDSFIITPEGAPEWAQDRASLWSEAEAAEHRSNGRLATEFELALPHELSRSDRRRLIAGFAQGLVERYGVAADIAIHLPGHGGDHRNHHAHMLVSHRELGEDGFGEIANTQVIERLVKGRMKEVKVAGIANKADIKPLHREWEAAVNRAYEEAGLDIRVDHRSHVDRGLDIEPTQHMGPSASAMERQGIQTIIGDANREITARNAERAALTEEYERISAEIIDLAAERLVRRNAKVIAPDPYERNEAAEIIAWDDALSANAILSDILRPIHHRPMEPPSPPKEERPLSETAGNIRLAYQLSESAEGFAAALQERGLSVARVSAEEAATSERIAAFAKALGRFAPIHGEGDLVAVNGFGHVYGLNQRTTGDTSEGIAAYLATVDREGFEDVTATRGAMREATRAAFLAGWLADRPKSEMETQIAEMREEAEDASAFVASMQAEGLYIARASAADIEALKLEHQTSFATAGLSTDNPYDLEAHERTTVPGWLSSALDDGELVAVDRFGGIYRFNPAHSDTAELAALWTEASPDGFGSIGDITSLRCEVLAEQIEQEAAWQEARNDQDAEDFDLACDIDATAYDGAAKGEFSDAAIDAADGFARGAARLLEGLGEGLVSAVDGFIAEPFESLFAPPSPMEQIAAKRAADRAAEGRVSMQTYVDEPAQGFAALSQAERLQRATALMQRRGRPLEGDDLSAEQADEALQTRYRNV